LKSIHRATEIKKYDGNTLGIDGYGWLHRGAVACAIELAQGKPTRKYVDFVMHRVRLFKHFRVTPYFVFDGDYLPSKAGTEASREKRREASRKAGLELLKAGKPAQAHQELQKAIDVTPEMARLLIEELKKAQVPYVVAPYEADAQLIYLERQGLIDGIVSEDSDLLVFGAKRLLTKMDQHGQCIEINRKDFCGVREISLTGWTDTEFRHMAIFSGCDYLDGLSNMGLKTAYRMIRKHKTPERIVRMLQFDGKFKVPENYLEAFKRAELTFLYQRVFCPDKQDVVFLTDPDSSVDVDNMPFIGAAVETELARAVARGDVNPITKKPIVIPPSPGKRRISQVSAPVNVAKKSLGKPISEYFGSRRIPLGEMDPNCFATKPHQGAESESEGLRPIVFPLPRPYLDESASATESGRHYTSRSHRRRTVPVAEQLLSFVGSVSQNRRHTAGPTIQIYQDPGSSTRPPKKARLCEDLPSGGAMKQTPERSKFFSAKKKEESSKDQFLMSDDSIDEVLRNLPDLSSQTPTTSSGSSGFIQLFGGSECPGSGTSHVSAEAVADGGDINANDEIEVPASSPLAPPSPERTKSRSMSKVSPGNRLQRFGYDSTRPAARVVHGLPTPCSSTERPSSPKPTPSRGVLTPRLTPLQRIGAQALQRDRARAAPRGSRSSVHGDKSRPFASPCSVPLPKVDLDEVESLCRTVGSEDQIVPVSDEEDNSDDSNLVTCADQRLRRPETSARRLNLSQFLYC
jgi:exonuclease 1